MDREIKFRIWDINKKVFMPEDTYFIISTDFNAFAVMSKDWQNYREGEYLYQVSHKISQYSGFMDINGEKIYEGYILKSFSNSIAAYEVFFYNGSFRLRYKLQSGEYYDWGLLSRIFEIEEMNAEIIGNIYEHPNLLTPKAPNNE